MRGFCQTLQTPTGEYNVFKLTASHALLALAHSARLEGVGIASYSWLVLLQNCAQEQLTSEMHVAWQKAQRCFTIKEIQI